MDAAAMSLVRRERRPSSAYALAYTLGDLQRTLTIPERPRPGPLQRFFRAARLRGNGARLAGRHSLYAEALSTARIVNMRPEAITVRGGVVVLWTS